jgi:hypothetical protein
LAVQGLHGFHGIVPLDEGAFGVGPFQNDNFPGRIVKADGFTVLILESEIRGLGADGRFRKAARDKCERDKCQKGRYHMDFSHGFSINEKVEPPCVEL